MKIITKEYLQKNPNHILVFGDNNDRIGHGGCAKLRDYQNTYGFITKRKPNNDDTSFYKPNDYKIVFIQEINKLKKEIEANPDKIYLITKLGAGLANKFKIWEQVIEPNIKDCLEEYKNVKFLF